MTTTLAIADHLARHHPQVVLLADSHLYAWSLRIGHRTFLLYNPRRPRAARRHDRRCRIDDNLRLRTTHPRPAQFAAALLRALGQPLHQTPAA